MKIKLTNSNKKVLVDYGDYLRLKKYNWYLSNGHVMKWPNDMMCYHIKSKNKNQRYSFKNKNPLDLRKKNIDIVSWTESSLRNRKTTKKTSSKYKGVCFLKQQQKWCAYLSTRKNGKRIRLLYRTYNTEKEAAKARDKAVIQHFGNNKLYLNNPKLNI